MGYKTKGGDMEARRGAVVQKREFIENGEGIRGVNMFKYFIDT